MKTLGKIIVGILAVIGALVLIPSRYISQFTQSLGGQNANFQNVLQTMTHTNTSTSASLPVKLLARNDSRNYALIENDSDTVVYIYLSDFASASAASTTVIANRGIRINANGGAYEITPANLYTGDIWMATTTASKNIIISSN